MIDDRTLRSLCTLVSLAEVAVVLAYFVPLTTRVPCWTWVFSQGMFFFLSFFNPLKNKHSQRGSSKLAGQLRLQPANPRRRLPACSWRPGGTAHHFVRIVRVAREPSDAYFGTFFYGDSVSFFKFFSNEFNGSLQTKPADGSAGPLSPPATASKTGKFLRRI